MDTLFWWSVAATPGQRPFKDMSKLPKIFLYQWWGFLGFREGVCWFQGNFGRWAGGGNWSVFPPNKMSPVMAEKPPVSN